MKKRGFLLLILLAAGVWAWDPCAGAEDLVRVVPAPDGEPLSPDFTVCVGQKAAPVYLARVCSLTPEQRQKLGTPQESGTSLTSFTSFDLRGPVEVSVICPQASRVGAAKILPSSSGITPVVDGNRVTFTVSKPGQFVLEIDGDWVHSLQVFANPWEADPPSPTDPKVIYFGPGIHEVESVKVTSGQTVYLAAGAVVYGKFGPGSAGGAIFSLEGDSITLRGRGIIDGSRCPYHTRSILYASGKHIAVEGVTLRDSSGWTFPVRRSDDVRIRNVKIFGWRGNSDGIDLCNCRGAEVSDSYLRTFDDLIVIKTDHGQGEGGDIVAKHCVLWNEFAHALSLGAELREKVGDVLFTDCDIVHDKGREWLLRVYQCDSAPIENVVFDTIRIEEAQRFMSLWIGKAIWSREDERGHIDRIVFRNIDSPPLQRADPPADLVGFDAAHAIHGAIFDKITVGGHPLRPGDVKQNAFVDGVQVTP